MAHDFHKFRYQLNFPRLRGRSNVSRIGWRPLAGEDLCAERARRIERWGDAGACGFLGHGESDFDSETAKIFQGWEKRRGGIFQSGRMFSETASGRDHHGVRDALNASGCR